MSEWREGRNESWSEWIGRWIDGGGWLIEIYGGMDGRMGGWTEQMGEWFDG